MANFNGVSLNPIEIAATDAAGENSLDATAFSQAVIDQLTTRGTISCSAKPDGSTVEDSLVVTEGRKNVPVPGVIAQTVEAPLKIKFVLQGASLPPAPLPPAPTSSRVIAPPPPAVFPGGQAGGHVHRRPADQRAARVAAATTRLPPAE